MSGKMAKQIVAMDPRYFFFHPETSGFQKKFWDDKNEKIINIVFKQLYGE